MDQREIALAAAKALDDKRGKDIVVLKVDEMTVITDYMVIAAGRSVPQVKALAEQVEEELAKHDVFARRREGLSEGRWCIFSMSRIVNTISWNAFGATAPTKSNWRLTRTERARNKRCPRKRTA